MFLTSFGGQLPGRQLPNHFYPIVIPISVQWNNHIIAKFYIWCCRFKLQQKNNIFIFVHFNSSSSVSWFFGKIRFVWVFGFFKHWCHSAISISKNNYFLITLQKIFSISRLKMIVCEHFPIKKFTCCYTATTLPHTVAITPTCSITLGTFCACVCLMTPTANRIFWSCYTATTLPHTVAITPTCSISLRTFWACVCLMISTANRISWI